MWPWVCVYCNPRRGTASPKCRFTHSSYKHVTNRKSVKSDYIRIEFVIQNDSHFMGVTDFYQRYGSKIYVSYRINEWDLDRKMCVLEEFTGYIIAVNKRQREKNTLFNDTVSC